MRPDAVEQLYSDEFGRVLASVIRQIGDFELAEDAVQDAFETAMQQWPAAGWPRNPRSWLISTARFKAIDRLRRAGRLREIGEELGRDSELDADREARDEMAEAQDESVEDERLRLIFTCCHPAIAPEAQVALALRTLCGLATEEIARAFLVAPATLAQRLVRAKRKIRDAGIPYEIPPRERIPERLDAVAATLYLVFNEGYAATSGDRMIRVDLCREAIRLARLLSGLLPEEHETRGLLALMLLHDARRAGRTTPAGEVLPLEDQDRSLWDRAQIADGIDHCRAANAGAQPGPYALQAAIAAEHARTHRPDETDWPRIAALYADLVAIRPSPAVELNRAVAVAMAEGLEAGLARVAALKRGGSLDAYAPLWSTEAEILRRVRRFEQAAASYRRALELVTSEPERRFLARRLEACGTRARPGAGP